MSREKRRFASREAAQSCMSTTRNQTKVVYHQRGNQPRVVYQQRGNRPSVVYHPLYVLHRTTWVRTGQARLMRSCIPTSPQSGSKSLFSGHLACAASRWIPVSFSPNHGNRKGWSDSTLWAGGHDGSGAIDAKEQRMKAWSCWYSSYKHGSIMLVLIIQVWVC